MIKQGDIIKINFDPIQGHEQGGYRPAVVLSNDFIIGITNIILICPISNTSRDFPLHIKLDKRTETSGFIFCEHTRAVDLQTRSYSFIERLPDDLLTEIINRAVCSIQKYSN